MKKLTIVVNCTDRKSVQAAPNLRARSLSSVTLADRFEEWNERLTASPTDGTLLALYQGEAWTQVKLLKLDAEIAGYDVRLKVASAGLGLREVETKAPAYAATFTGGHLDTIASGAQDSQTWWSLLNGLDGAGDLKAQEGDKILLVLSENYARAMDRDLVALAASMEEVLLVGGSRHIDGIPRLPADRAMRSELGGTVSSVTIRMARAWLRRRSTDRLYDPADHRSWDRWSTRVRIVDNYDRQTASDERIRGIAAELKASRPGISASGALRIVRDSGIACEQKRFGAIFKSAEGGER